MRRRMRRVSFALLLLAMWVSPASAQPPRVATSVTVLSAANTQVTATVPASAAPGQHLYISSIQVMRTCTTAITGTAALDVTTTNLSGSPVWTMGNACLVGSTNRDVEFFPDPPLRSTAPGTAVTVVCPAIGATGVCRITVTYVLQ